MAGQEPSDEQDDRHPDVGRLVASAVAPPAGNPAGHPSTFPATAIGQQWSAAAWDPSGRGRQQNDGPLINVSPGRHPESSSNVHPLPTASLQVSADEAVTLRRPPYAW